MCTLTVCGLLVRFWYKGSVGNLGVLGGGFRLGEAQGGWCSVQGCVPAILDQTGHGPAQRIDLTPTERYPVAERTDAAEELARLLSGMDAAAK